MLIGLGQSGKIFYSCFMSDLELRLQELEEQIIQLKKENEGLIDLVALLRRKQYGKSSEQVPAEQLGMFDETEVEALNPEPEDDESIIVPAHQRKRGKRLKLPENLPRVEVIIDIESKTCPIEGKNLKCIGEDVSEKLEIIPAKVRVIKTIRKKYACPACETIQQAPAPLEMIPKSNSSASVLAYIATAKYVDALPLYRQEAIFKRVGLDLSRQTMARWMIQIGEKIEPLVKLLREELLKSHYLHMDETVVQVLKEDGKKAETNSYMWVQARSGANPIILFHYAKNRSGDHARELLEEFRGALQVDGYDGYAGVISDNGITRLGCWAHARRKFFDAFKSSSGKSIGKQGLVYIKKIYEIEEEIQGRPFAERFNFRLTRSVPILKDFEKWIQEQVRKVNPESLSGKALKYTTNEWQYLMNCFSEGSFRIDNNYIESHIRPFTIGRKNWMFSVKPEGAVASANIYSLVETAKANSLDPFDYLKKVFEKLPSAQMEADFLELLPVKIK
ncbi:MAG TPA: IS66 family transposase [Bacteriovoracaceae bacterium]|nr:IS66 family transposase [Bacteriovoracaceae bacterium]